MQYWFKIDSVLGTPISSDYDKGFLQQGTTSDIKASQIRREIVCRFQEHLGLFGKDHVSISERRGTVHGIMCRS